MLDFPHKRWRLQSWHFYRPGTKNRKCIRWEGNDFYIGNIATENRSFSKFSMAFNDIGLLFQYVRSKISLINYVLPISSNLISKFDDVGFNTYFNQKNLMRKILSNFDNLKKGSLLELLNHLPHWSTTNISLISWPDLLVRLQFLGIFNKNQTKESPIH